jgi:citrate lyase subunit beta/citryl-CoA lyase
MSSFLMRSLMFVPGHNEKLLNSASLSDADVLLLDIEDSVQPLTNKQVARDKIKEWVALGKFNKHLVFPRINDRESGQLLKDVYQLSIPGVGGFMYPKSKKGEDIYFIDKLLETIEYEKGLEIGTFKLIPLIETAAAVLNAQQICEASKRVIAIAFGCEDFITDLEGIHDIDQDSLFTPRAMIAMAARATGVIPIDTVHIKVHDLADLEKNLIISRNLGFEGMMILHPKELPLAHKYYSPSNEDLEWAKEIILLSQEAFSAGKGVVMKDNKFIGPPIVKMAKKIIARNNLIME